MATYNIRTTSVQDWRDTMMSKAEFNAVAAERRVNRAGSGFDEWGKTKDPISTNPTVNEGLWTNATLINYFTLGRLNGIGISKTSYPVATVSGVVHQILGVSSSSIEQSYVYLPPAPTVLPSTATLTQQQIDSGVIKHADASNSGLIVNGKFDTDTSGWSASTATLSVVSGVLRVTLTSTTGYASQSFVTVIGKKYTVEYYHTAGTSAGIAYVKIGTSAGASTNATSTSVAGRNTVEFTATATTTYISLEVNGVIGEYDDFDNIAVFPADAISRSDLVFLESWHEDVSEKDFVYPLGNVQYLGTTGDSGTPVTGAFAGAETYSLFSDTWQADSTLVGNGYVWSTLSDANKKAFVANPENNCYLDGDKVIQVRYRMRVVIGAGDSWLNTSSDYVSEQLRYSSPFRVKPKGKLSSLVTEIGAYTAEYDSVFSGYGNDLTVHKNIGSFTAQSSTGALLSTHAYEGKCFAMPIALVHRRNQGAYHPVYNANGTAYCNATVLSVGRKWYESTTIPLTSISSAFTSVNNTVDNTTAGYLAFTGNIGTVSARADGIFYDQIHEGDILDLRNSSQKVEDYNRLIDREFNKAVAGTTRGSGGELNTEVKTQTTTGTVATVEVNDGTKYKSGDAIYIYDLTASAVKGRFTVKSISTNTLTVDVAFAKLANSYMISGGSTTRTKSNTITMTDLIGSPANLPANMKLDGQSFNTLHTAEDGTSMLPTGALTTFKLSRKANATPLQVLKSADSGATWTALTVTTHYTFNTVTNVLTMVTAPAVGDLIMVTYQTKTNMTVSAVNSEVLSVGDVYGISYGASVTIGGYLAESLIKKVLTNTTSVHTDQVSLTKKRMIGTAFSTNALYSPENTPVLLASVNVPAVKVFPYLTRSNGKAYLNLVFKEMKYDSGHDNITEFNQITDGTTALTYTAGQYYVLKHTNFGDFEGVALYMIITIASWTATNFRDLLSILPNGNIVGADGTLYAKLWDGNGWGDDNKFNIVDNVSTTIDDNAQTVLIGQKRIELPYFIAAGE